VKILLLNKTFLLDYRQFPDIYVLQGSAATRMRCDGVFNDHYVTRFESDGERILKSVNRWQSYGQEYGVLLILTHDIFRHSRLVPKVCSGSTLLEGGNTTVSATRD